MYYKKIGEIQDYILLSRHALATAEHEMGRELLRDILREHLGIEDYTISIGEHGKPYLEGLPYHFSISHSRGIVICVVSDKPIGVDIERLRDIPSGRVRALSERFFTKDEQEYLAKKEFGSRDFLFIWTRKEARSKFEGVPFMEAISLSCLDIPELMTATGENYIYSEYEKF